MLSWVRKLLSNWVARVFFGLLVVVFVFWGVQNVFTLMSASTAVATVGGQQVDASTVQAAYQTVLGQLGQGGNQPPPTEADRADFAQRALSQVIEQKTLNMTAQALGVVVPDDVLSQLIDSVPGFQVNGAFNQAQMAAVLANNNSSPALFIQKTRDAIADEQLLAAAQAGAVMPAGLSAQLIAYLYEQRQAETALFAASDQPAPAPPVDAVLQRYWRNHPANYTLPEYRTAKIVILSPALLADQEPVTDADVQSVFNRIMAENPIVPVRSVQVITAQDAASAAKLAKAWNAKNASWPAVQALALKLGASAVELDKSTQVQIPTPALGQAVFAAPANVVTGPVQGPFGLYVFKVTDVSTNGPDPNAVRDQLKHMLQVNKAQSDMPADEDNFQDALAGQTPLDQLPGNIGLVAVEGTLDAMDHTPQGGVAPIPGGEDVRNAVIKAIFSTPVNTPPQMLSGPSGSYFAVQVESITPPAVQPFAQARAAVLADWTNDQLMHEAEVKAAAMLQAVKSGQNFQVAAESAGVQEVNTPLVSRDTRDLPPDSPAAGLAPLLFGLAPGQAVMNQVGQGVLVAMLTNVTHPTPADVPAEAGAVQTDVTKAMRGDIEESILQGLRQRYPVTVNQKLFAQIYQ